MWREKSGCWPSSVDFCSLCVVPAQWTGAVVIQHGAAMHSTWPVGAWGNLNFIFRVESIKKVPGDITQCNNEHVLVHLHMLC